MKRKSVWIGLAFVAAVVGALVYSTASVGGYRVEVCMEFQGRSSCRTASASSEEAALRTAKENACALIASGVTDSIQCTSNIQPKSVRWIERR